MQVLDNEIYKILNKKFKIILSIDSAYYDNKLEQLENNIKDLCNHSFNQNEKILILYHDTNFYIDLISGSSLFLNNLYEILKKYSIPQEFVLFITNHYGIKKEIDLLNLKFNYEIQNLIETSLWYDFPNTNHFDEFDNINLDFDNEYLFTCLNNIQRIHRNYILCQLEENNLIDRGIVSYRFKK